MFDCQWRTSTTPQGSRLSLYSWPCSHLDVQPCWCVFRSQPPALTQQLHQLRLIQILTCCVGYCCLTVATCRVPRVLLFLLTLALLLVHTVLLCHLVLFYMSLLLLCGCCYQTTAATSHTGYIRYLYAHAHFSGIHLQIRLLTENNLSLSPEYDSTSPIHPIKNPPPWPNHTFRTLYHL